MTVGLRIENGGSLMRKTKKKRGKSEEEQKPRISSDARKIIITDQSQYKFHVV